MRLRLIPAAFADSAPELRAAGVASVRFDEEHCSGVTFCVPALDDPDDRPTIPCPPPAFGEDDPPPSSVTYLGTANGIDVLVVEGE